MVEDRSALRAAQDGLKQIEDAIISLLEVNPQGLRNVQIASLLDLSSAFNGRQRGYLTYSVLGGLLTTGRIRWNQETKLFTALRADTTPLESAQRGFHRIQDAVLSLLDANPQGLRNAEIAELLDLHSDFNGRQRDYLTYSVLGGLLDDGRVAWDQRTKIFTKPS